MPTYPSRDEALVRLQSLIGQDLRQLARQYGITVFKENGGFNKGWPGHVLERYLGLPLNSLQSRDFGDWELKIVPLIRRKGRLVPKETMAITMINPTDIIAKPFRQSHLYDKLFSMIICGRLFVDRQETYSILERCETFDFDDHEDKEMIDQIEQDYEYVRRVLSEFTDPREGLQNLSGRMGVYVQPRTKGAGHGSISRAFYMRTSGLKKLLKL